MNKRLKIRFIAGDIKWPIPDGVSIRQQAVLNALSAFGDVDMLCHSNQRPRLVVPESQQHLCRRCVVQANPLATVRGVSIKKTMYPMATLTTLIGQAQRYSSSEAVKIINRDYDITWIARISNMWRYRHAAGRSRCVVDIDDLKHREYGRDTYSEDFKWQHRLTRLLLHKLWKKVELDALTRSEKSVVCSRIDQDFLNHHSIAVVHNAVLIPSKNLFRAGKPGRIIFVGNMNFAPNVDGVSFFVTEILPLIKRSYPEAHLHVVGSDPVDRVRRLDDGTSVRVLGVVPDVAPHLANSAISIAPIRMGCGTRLKIIESLAYRTPVVSTSVGAEGLEFSDGLHIRIADSPQTFAAACVRLLRSEKLRVETAASGYKRVRALYSYEYVKQQIGAIIDDLMRNSKTGPIWHKPR